MAQEAKSHTIRRPEYISHLLATCVKKHHVKLLFIQPGKPQHNAYAERFNHTVSYDWLNRYIFQTIDDVQQAATAWLWTY
ncbi:MAG: transposase, partial [Kordiimonadaceae bacterium]|nr:transposase [Kordiimonadaceae bacterium]